MSAEWIEHSHESNTFFMARDAEIVVGDGTVLKANVYAASATDSPQPTIVNMGPYGKDIPLRRLYPERWSRMVRQYPDVLSHSTGRLLAWEVPDPERWVPLGYNLVHVDARGTNGSGGVWDPNSPRENQDFADCIDWIAAQPWCDGRVAVMGVSYYGMAAWRVAQLAPRALKAIVPWHGGADLYRDVVRHGGILSSFADLWWYRWSREATRYAAGDACEPPAANNWPDIVRERAFIDDWYAERSVDWSKVKVPFLSVGNWGTVGLHLRGNIDGFVQAASENKWLHVLAGKQGRLEQFHSDWGVALQKDFLDRFMRDEGGAWSAVPKVALDVRLPGGGARTRTDDEWPPASTSWLRLHLDAGRRTLDVDPPVATSRTGYYGPSDGVRFRTGPFVELCEVTGPIALTLACSTPAEDVDLFVTLHVADETGCRVDYQRVFEKAITRGWLRLSHRELDPQSPEWQPRHRHIGALAVRPDEVYGVQIEIVASSFVIPKGGRLILHISGMDGPDTEQTRHADPTDRPVFRTNAVLRLHSGPGHETYLTLPVQEPRHFEAGELVGSASEGGGARAAAY